MAADEEDVVVLFGQIGVEFEEGGAGHGVVDEALVPQVGGEDGAQALGRRRAHPQPRRFLIPQSLLLIYIRKIQKKILSSQIQINK